MTHDYTEYKQKTKSAVTLDELAQLADDLDHAKRELEEAEAETARAKAALRYLEEERVPEAMAELELEEFSTRGGLKIEIKENVFAHITRENEEEAYRWLDENGHGGMIKRLVVVSFDREQEEAARALQDKIRGEYPGVKEKCSIHNQTLRAWARRQLEEGEVIPETISIERKPVAKIKRKK